MILFAARAAFAAACCGTASDTPTTLARCEHVGGAVVVGGTTQLARWDASGAVAPTSDHAEQLTGTLGVAGRFARWGYVSVGMPVVATWRDAGTLESSGAGLGDLSAAVRLQPSDTLARGFDLYGDLGVLAPTGLGPAGSTDVLAADVTGQGSWMGTATFGVSRVPGLWPWHADVRGLYGPGAYASRVEGDAGVGRRLTEHWLLAADLAFAQGIVENTRHTSVTVRTVVDPSPRYRAWLAVTADTPLPSLGLSYPVEAGASAGLLLVY